MGTQLLPGDLPASIHPSAVIGPGVQLGAGVRIGAYAVLGEDVQLGDHCVVEAHAVLRPRVRLGSHVRVDSFAVLGGPPQDRNFDQDLPTWVEIGSDVIIREGVTVHRSTDPARPTRIGTGTMLMANSHVAHDCQVGAAVTLCNNVMLAGHVEIADGANLGGGAGIHQFVRIGAAAMISGNASMSYDVPPYAVAAGRNALRGLNLIGLRRQNLPRAEIEELKRYYRAVFLQDGDPFARARELQGAAGQDLAGAAALFLEFFESNGRGFIRVPQGRRQRFGYGT